MPLVFQGKISLGGDEDRLIKIVRDIRHSLFSSLDPLTIKTSLLVTSDIMSVMLLST